MTCELVTNSTGFAPLGTVRVAMLGIAVAEGSGLIGAALKLVVLSAPPRALTLAVGRTPMTSKKCGATWPRSSRCGVSWSRRSRSPGW
jgi:p-aminobenzoyl-glutamate transporter AbgT